MIRRFSILFAAAAALAACTTVKPIDPAAIDKAQAAAIFACGVAPTAAQLAKLWGVDGASVDKAAMTGALFCEVYLKAIAPPDGPKVTP